MNTIMTIQKYFVDKCTKIKHIAHPSNKTIISTVTLYFITQVYRAALFILDSVVH